MKPALRACVFAVTLASTASIGFAQVVFNDTFDSDPGTYKLASRSANSTFVSNPTLTFSGGQLSFRQGDNASFNHIVHNGIFVQFASTTLAVGQSLQLNLQKAAGTFGVDGFLGGAANNFVASFMNITNNPASSATNTADNVFAANNGHVFRSGTGGGTSSIARKGTGTVNAFFGTALTTGGTATSLTNDALNIVYTITRSSETQVDLSMTVNGGVAFTAIDTTPASFTYNTLALVLSAGNNANTQGFTLDSLSLTVIPEPSAFAAIAGLGVLGLAASRRRSRVA